MVFSGESAFIAHRASTDSSLVSAVLKVISHPCFNDLHHVTVGPQDTLFVAVTGLDAVAEVTLDGELIRLTSTVEGVDVWDRFSPDVDYRRCASTKPHASHQPRALAAEPSNASRSSG